MNASWELQDWIYQSHQPPPPTVPMDQYNNYPPYSLPADNKMGFQQSQLEAYSEPVEPDADPGDVAARQLLKERLKMLVFAALSLVILIFNVAVLCAYARGVGSPGPTIPVFRGTCPEAARFGLWIHLLVNALAVGLALASSNGMRNLRLVRESQPDGGGGGGGAILFFFIASLLPICVLYNAAIYQTVGANAFYAAVVGEDFFSAGPTTLPAALANSNFSGFDAAYGDMLANGSSWVRMDNLECIETYSAVFLHDYRNVILVASNSSSPAALYQAFYVDWRTFLSLDPEPGVSNAVYAWMCPPDAWIVGNQVCSNSVCYYTPPQTCTLSGLESNATTWTVPLSETASIYNPDMLPSPIEYCLAEPSASQCSIGLNWYFLLVVAVCNAVKLICQLLSLRFLRKTGRMLTVGDQRRRAYERRPTRWIQAYKWHGSILLLCVILLLVGLTLSQALRAEKRADLSIDITSLWHLGFGTVSLDLTISGLGLGLGHTAGSGAILGVSLLTSAPQFVITLLFFNFTYALTVMEAYSKCARPNPSAAQLAKPARDLPLYYAVIVSVIQFVVHWMASQAFFPIVVQTLTSEFYDFGPIGIGSLGDGGLYVTAGFSPIAIIFTLISLIVAFSLLLGMGSLRKYRWVGLNR